MRYIPYMRYIRLQVSGANAGSCDYNSIVTEETSSSEIRRRIRPSAEIPERQSSNFAETERAFLSEGEYTMVDGLLTPAVLAHIIRYQLYARKK